MVTEDYVSFETAKLLKEKGFDISVTKYYTLDGELMESNPEWNWNDGPFYSRPSLAMAMKWLREEKKIGIEININFNRDGDKRWYYEYGFCIFQLSGAFKKLAECDYDGYKTYEEACEAAIKYALENLM